ncbi:MAG: hypothetical protein ACJ735_05050 [Actinomycetes bacterium]
MAFVFSAVRGTTAAALALICVAGCSSGGSKGPSPTPTPAAATQLQQIAAAGLQNSYTAVYKLRATKPAGTALVVVGRTPTAYRLNLHTGRSIAILIHNAHGTYSCHKDVGHAAKCLQVAKPGSPVPPLFDAGQKLWSDFLVELSNNASAYLVTPAGTTPATGSAPAGKCYAIHPIASPAPAATVTPGTYCLTADGIPTEAAFVSGTVMLTEVTRPPKPRELLPLAKPIPIPNLR